MCKSTGHLQKTWPKTKAFKPIKNRVSFTILSILSCGWVDATVAAYLGFGWVGGFFFLIYFYFICFFTSTC
jgi:hypothetical protein